MLVDDRNLRQRCTKWVATAATNIRKLGTAWQAEVTRRAPADGSGTDDAADAATDAATSRIRSAQPHQPAAGPPGRR